MKRQRGRGRKGGGGGQHQSNRALESNGPDVKVRGAAVTIYEKYLQLSRDASSSGDRVKAENYLQHAEHYFRIMRAQEESRRDRDEQRQQNQPNQNQGGQNQSGQNQGGQQNQQRGQNSGQDNDGDDGRQSRQNDSRQSDSRQSDSRQSDSRQSEKAEARSESRSGGKDKESRDADKDAGKGGPLEMVTPEEGDITEAAAEKKPRRTRRPKKAEAAEGEPATEDAA